MTALNRKLLRDLWHLRGQSLAIVLVIASGVATFLMSLTTLAALEQTRARFYREYHFADVFAVLKRAPESLARQLAGIDGVAGIETRVQAPMTLNVEGFDDPVRGTLLSLPRAGPRLNALYLRAGRLPDPDALREIVVGEAFATAHGLRPGDTLSATVVGHQQRWTIVGIAISPEFVYQIQAGAAFPDFKRYGVFWAAQRAVEAAFDMDGAFNALSMRLQPGVRTQPVIDEVDVLLRRYGGLGAYPRADQLSHKFLNVEFENLRTMSVMFPTIFLAVAAFLLNVVFSRLIATQREQIAILKAFGYSHAAIGLHYTAMVGIIVALGAVVGLVAGQQLGRGLSSLYMTFYRFPFLDFELPPRLFVAGLGISLAASLSGAAFALLRAFRLPPAEAMRPEAPARFRRSLAERLGFGRWLDQPTRMIVRQLERHWAKSLFTVLGLSLASGILMIGMFQQDALFYMVDMQFARAQRNDIHVRFDEPLGRAALHELARMPGVRAVEGSRSIAVRLRYGPRNVRTSLEGLERGSDLKRALDTDGRVQPIPSEGLLLTDHLGTMLDARVGDLLTVEELQGRQRVMQIPIAALVKEYIGVSAYLEAGALDRLLGDGERVSGAYLAIDANAADAIERALQRQPHVAAIGARKVAIENFYDTLAESLLIFTFIISVLACVIAFGVVYNTARIALSERSRELASLRVLGFTRGEIGYILIGELALLTLIAIPVGALVGWTLCWTLSQGLQSDLFRIPPYVSARTFAYAAAVLLVASVASALLLIVKLHRLDLIAVLKMRE